jgi:uncharacterized integral membrane protein
MTPAVVLALHAMVYSHAGEVHLYDPECAGSIIAGPRGPNGTVFIADLLMQTAFILDENYEKVHEVPFGLVPDPELMPAAMTHTAAECALILRGDIYCQTRAQTATMCAGTETLQWVNTTDCPCVAKFRTKNSTATDDKLVHYVLDTTTGSVFIYNTTSRACTAYTTFNVSEVLQINNAAGGLAAYSFDVNPETNRIVYYVVTETNSTHTGASLVEVDHDGTDRDVLPLDIWSGSTIRPSDLIPGLVHAYGDVFLDLCGNGNYIITVGEAAYDNTAVQFFGNLMGKAVRVFYDRGAGTVSTELLAVGFRHPWMSAFHENTCKLLVADVGGHRFENLAEISLTPPANSKPPNYMFPFLEHDAVHSLYGTLMEDTTPTSFNFSLAHCDDDPLLRDRPEYLPLVVTPIVLVVASLGVSLLCRGPNTSPATYVVMAVTLVLLIIVYSVPHLMRVTAVDGTVTNVGLWYYYQPQRNPPYRLTSTACPRCYHGQPDDLLVASVAAIFAIAATPMTVSKWPTIPRVITALSLLLVVSLVCSSYSRVYQPVEAEWPLAVCIFLLFVLSLVWMFAVWPARLLESREERTKRLEDPFAIQNLLMDTFPTTR